MKFLKKREKENNPKKQKGEGWGFICSISPPLTLKIDYKVEMTMGGMVLSL
jgi:hypothetical protein